MLGDITDAKDYHSAELVNRVISSIASIKVKEITILAGNHDWLKRGQEFFRFLNEFPGIRFITSPTEDPDNAKSGRPSAFYLPYSKAPATEWVNLDLSWYDYVFMHQTVKGAVASNGESMEGEGLPDLSKWQRIYSGDIHVPQTIGNLTYVGSPYHVHFGDAFKPRCILLDENGREKDLHFKTVSRVVVNVMSLRALHDLNLRRGDQVKLRYTLGEMSKHMWQEIRREAVAILEDYGVEVHGVELKVLKAGPARISPGEEVTRRFSPDDAMMHFVEREEWGGRAYEAALRIQQRKESNDRQ